MIRRPNPGIIFAFWAVMMFLYLPLGAVVFQAFLSDPYNWNSPLTLKWLGQLLDSSQFWEPLINSLMIATASASLSTTLGTFGAVGMRTSKMNLAPAAQSLIMLPILLPEIITGLSLLLFFLLIRVPLGFLTVILAHASFSASFVYFVMAEQMRKLDPQLEEAAQDLGATPREVFWRVTLPNILPGIFGGFLLSFTLSFDDFLISFFTSGAGVTTLPLKIYSLMRIGISPELNAMCFFMIGISTLLVLSLVWKEESRKWLLRS
jgi:ABC-type spermidine/putrescine transport system permease subunit II